MNDYIVIDNLRDLEKAQYAFLTNAKTIFENGEVCRGQDIISIKEDWNKEMGWNSTFRDKDGNVRIYELSNDDLKEIKKKKVDEKYLGVLANSKRRVQYLIDNKKIDLIGKGIEINFPELPNALLEKSNELADKMKVK